MTRDIPAAARDALDEHPAFESQNGGFTITTTAFDSVVTPNGMDDERISYTVTVRVPTLEAATADEVGDAVGADWLRTLTRRLEDAPAATRKDVTLDSFTVEQQHGEVRIEYAFTWGNPAGAADIAKTLVEFVEGTYVEGIVPGYEYEPPVADLLASATQGGKSGTPL